MTRFVSLLLQGLVSLLRARRDLAFKNLPLRQQLVVLKGKGVRPQLSQTDRFFWALILKIWLPWRDVLHVVRPKTVIRWHREGFRRHWAQKCRKVGQPPIDPQIRILIRRMCEANALCEATKIHGELLKVGIKVSEARVSKYMVRHPKPPSQT